MSRATCLVTTAVTLMLIGCATTGETTILPPDEQFARAMEQLEAGDYAEAVASFQAFTFNYPQDPRVVEARWSTAEAYYRSEDWVAAAQEYLNFQRDFPAHERAAEALFQAGRSYQRMSLRPELDQRDTERAINVYDRVLTEYGGSDYAAEARERRRELRNKLAEKVYLNAEFYYDNEDYRSAEIYLVQLIESHPDSDWVAAGYALLAQSYCAQGLSDRAAEVSARLAEAFPDSAAARALAAELPARCRTAASPAVRADAATDGR